MIVGYAEIIGNVQMQEDSLEFVGSVVEYYLLELMVGVGQLFCIVKPNTHKEYIAPMQTFAFIATIDVFHTVHYIAYRVAR